MTKRVEREPTDREVLLFTKDFKILFGKDRPPAERRDDARYEAGLWYDNVPEAHAAAARKAGAVEALDYKRCGCLVGERGTVVKVATNGGGDPICRTHRKKAS